jgi:ketosteroid isomerase-like protein
MVSPEGTIPASGKTIDLPFADYFGVKGGKVVNHRTYWDQATLMGQIGATPPG